MTDLRARLAEALDASKRAGLTWEPPQVVYTDAATLALAFCNEPALARALEDAERYAVVRSRFDRAKTSACVRVMNDLDIPWNPANTLDEAIDAARSK